MSVKYTPEFCDKQYNARAAVRDYAQYFERWRAASAQVRASRRCFLDRAYGKTDAERLDVFPARGETRALLVFIHGGYWRSLDKDDFSFLVPAFADHNVALAVPNYALAPKATLFEIVQQNLRAVAWLYRNAREYGADPDRIFVCGHSAGGHLTAMLLAAMWPRWEEGLPVHLVKGGLAISGLYDLEPLRHAPFLKNDIRLDANSAAHLSPACLYPATDAPLYTAVGGRESAEFKRQVKLLAASWKIAFRGDIAMPDDNHFSIVDKLGDGASPLYKGAMRMMGL